MPTLTGSPSLGARFARGAAWLLVGAAGSQGMALLASVISARMLGREEFGRLAMVISTVGSFGTLAGLGVGLTATRYVAALRRTQPKRAAAIAALSLLTSLVSGGLAAVAVALAAPQLAGGMLHAPELAPLLRLGAILLFFNAMLGAQIGCLSGFEAFRAVAIANFCQAAINLPAVVVGIAVAGAAGAVWAALFASLGACGAAALLLRAQLRGLGAPLRFRDAWPERRVLFAFALPAFLANAMVNPVLWLANTLLTARPDGYSQIALFNAANQWRTVALFLPTLLLQVTLPLLSAAWGEAEAERDAGYRKTLELTQTATVIIAFPVTAAMMFAASLVMSLYGPSFTEGDGVLIGVGLATLIVAVGSCTGPAIQAQGRMWLGFAINAVWGGSMLLMVWLASARYGALALAYAGAAAYLITTVWTLRFLRGSLAPRFVRRTYALLGAAVVITAAVSLTPARPRLALAAPVFAAMMYASCAALAPPGTLARIRSVRLRDIRSFRASSV